MADRTLGPTRALDGTALGKLSSTGPGHRVAITPFGRHDFSKVSTVARDGGVSAELGRLAHRVLRAKIITGSYQKILTVISAVSPAVRDQPSGDALIITGNLMAVQVRSPVLVKARETAGIRRDADVHVAGHADIVARVLMEHDDRAGRREFVAVLSTQVKSEPPRSMMPLAYSPVKSWRLRYSLAHALATLKH